MRAASRSRVEARRAIPAACIAVDWSGARTGAERRIWLGEARAGRLVRLECGRDRRALVAELIASARRDPSLACGLDFAFSLPRWFLRERGIRSSRALWRRVARAGEAWLECAEPPFWGRPGARRPPDDPQRPPWRACEGDVLRERGIGPKSVFQVGGAGTVGAGSLRGMPHLAELADAGFSIWPFDPPALPLVVEIYPRLLTGPVVRSSRVARALYLEAHFADQPRDLLRAAERSEDAFDAAVSALRMQRFAHQLTRPALPVAPEDRLEGRIWRPVRDRLFERW